MKPSTSASSPPKPERYQFVVAARGAAALNVMLFHSLNALPADTLTPVLAAVRNVTEFRAIGVHVFFAISGWCIAERLARARQRDETAALFCIERGLRIFPTYWAAVALTLLLRLASAPFNTTRFSDNFPAAAAEWIGTLLLLDPYLGTKPYLVVSWSLVYELGFYGCAALALQAMRWRVDQRLLFALGALLCLVPWIFRGSPLPWVVLGLWPHFFAGIAAWCLVRQGARVAGGLVLFALGCAAVTTASSENIGLAAAVGAALLLAAVHRWDRAISSHWLVRFFCWCGVISYSLYLLHVPLISATENLGQRFVPVSSPAFTIVWLTALALAMTCSWLLATYVEYPVQQWRRRRLRLGNA